MDPGFGLFSRFSLVLPGYVPSHSILPSCLAILFVGASIPCAAQSPSVRAGAAEPPPSVVFERLRYVELIDGARDRAATGYRSIYADPRFAADLRARAAWRAGQCFEAVGLTTDALKAYRWLAEEFDSGNPTLRLLSRERLRGLESGTSSPDAGTATPALARDLATVRLDAVREVSVRIFLEKRIEEVTSERERHEAAASAVKTAEAEAAVAHDLSARLAAAGVHVGFEAPAAMGSAPRRGERRAVSPPDHGVTPTELVEGVYGAGPQARFLREAVADRFVERTLALLIEGDRGGARRALDIASDLGHSSAELSSLSVLVDRAGSAQTLAHLARERLRDRHEEVVAVLRRELSRVVAQSPESGRTELVVRDLYESGLRRLASEPPYVRLDPEIGELSLRLRIRWTTVCEARRALEALWSWYVDEGQDVIARAVRLVSASEEARRYAARPATVEGTSIFAAVDAVARDLDREYLEARNSAAKEEDEDPAAILARSARLEEVTRARRLLAVWFPDLASRGIATGR